MRINLNNACQYCNRQPYIDTSFKKLCIFVLTGKIAHIMLYPIGIQDFEKIRKDGYVYVDKTDLVFSLTKKAAKRRKGML